MKHRFAAATSSLFAILLAFVIGAQTIVNNNRIYVNRVLGTNDAIILDETSAGYTSTYSTLDELIEAHEKLGAQIGAEGSVLLQSGGAIPLKDRKVALLGARAYDCIYGGKTGSSPKASQNVTLVDALKTAGFSIDPQMEKYYAENSEPKSVITTTFSSVNNKDVIGLYKVKETACPTEAEMTEGYETALVVIGRQSSEAGSFYLGTTGMSKKANEFDEGTNVLGLAKAEKAEIEFAIRNYERVVVLLNTSSAMEVPELTDEYAALATELDTELDVLWIGQPGNYGCLGVVSVLTGETAPSGKLPDTYVANGYSNPANINYGIFRFSDQQPNVDRAKNGWYEIWAEGIYTGYKYYETRYADTFSADPAIRAAALAPTGVTTGGDQWSYADEVVYPFGFGLSTVETKQVLNSAKIDMKGISVFNVTVTNLGNQDVKDVVAIYAQSPFTDYDKRNGVEKSAIQLLAFEKVLVPAGKSVTINVEADMEDIASYDAYAAKTFIMDYGDYYFAIGNGAHEALNHVLALQGIGGLYDHNGNTFVIDNPEHKAVKYTFVGDGEVDATTWSVSKNGTPITNQLSNADYNYYAPGTVDYLTRTRWNFPIAYTDLKSFSLNNEEMNAALNNAVYTIRTTDDTSAFRWGEDNNTDFAAVKATAGESVDYNSPAWDLLLDQLELSEVLASIGGGASYVKLPSINLATCWGADGPMGICDKPVSKRGANVTDPDGEFYIDPDGENANYFLNTMPIEVVIAATFDHEIFHAVGALFGNDGLWNGVRYLWAPGSNLHRTPYNARNHEYASEDAVLSAWLATDMCQSGRLFGLIIAPKHFAFNATENNRYGICEFFNEQSAREGELRSFRRAFEEGYAISTMTAFNRVGPVFASSHVGLITNILRNEWGVMGAVKTDLVSGAMVELMNIRDSVAAGTDQMLSEDAYRGSDGAWSYFTEEGLAGDAFMQQKLKESMHHVIYTMANSSAPAGKIVYVATWYDLAFQYAIIALGALTAMSFVLTIWFNFKKRGEAHEMCHQK